MSLRGIFDCGGVRKQNGHWQSSNIMPTIEDAVWSIKATKTASGTLSALVEGDVQFSEITEYSGNVTQNLYVAQMTAQLVAGRKYKLSLNISMNHSSPEYYQDASPLFPWGRGHFASDNPGVYYEPSFRVNDRLEYIVDNNETLFTINNYSGNHTYNEYWHGETYGLETYNDGWNDPIPWVDNFTMEVEFTCEKTGTYVTATGEPTAGYGIGLLNLRCGARGSISQEVSVGYTVEYSLTRIS